MTLRVDRDSVSGKEVSLSDIVAMCQDCTKLCFERTQRVVDNASRAPRGWEGVFHSVAEGRRNEDMQTCELRCKMVATACPSVDDLRKMESSKGQHTMTQSLSRCDHAAENFAALLFTLAHKPSKVSFDTTSGGPASQSKTGASDPPSEAHRKVLESHQRNQAEAEAARGLQHPAGATMRDRLRMAGLVGGSAPDTGRKEGAANETVPKW